MFNFIECHTDQAEQEDIFLELQAKEDTISDAINGLMDSSTRKWSLKLK